MRTALVCIGLGALVQIGVYAAQRVGAVEHSSAIRVMLWVTAGLYLLVASVVLSRARRVDFSPVWAQGDPSASGLLGAVVGLAAGVGVLGLGWLATGQLQVDSRVSAVVSERTLGRTVVIVVVTMVAAPLIEELLFRGLVVESLRARGARWAVLTGAALFSLWHLNGAALPYYLLCGIVLGWLYWRRGLKASMAAHAAFNGCIVVVAVALAWGPLHTVSANGISMKLPAAWHLAEADDTPSAVDLLVTGPSGAALVVVRQVLGEAEQVDLHQLATRLNSGSASPANPAVTVTTGTARVVQEGTWTGVRTGVVIDGDPGEMVLVPTAGALYEVTLISAGSRRARADFDNALPHLSLP